MEEDGSNLNHASPKTLDPGAQKKHAAMIERLSNLQQSRLQQSAARRSDSHSSPAFPSVQSFLDRFMESRRSIEAGIARCRALSADPDSKPHLKPELETVSTYIADLDKLVAENSYFLPSYEVRSSLKAIADLKESLENANSELLPRKKFSFKNKQPKKESSAPLKGIEETKISDVEKLNLVVRDSPGFRNREGGVLVKRLKSSGDAHGDFTLADLTSCNVYLIGKLRALFIHRVRDCHIYVGPVLGSTLIEDADRCTFMLASHQIRIHQARATDFYLRVRSRPIIEDSSGIRFGPYRLFYEGIDEELRDSGLGEETGNWAIVDDFRWLRAVQSPNWCVMPEEDRMGTIAVTDLEEQCDDN